MALEFIERFELYLEMINTIIAIGVAVLAVMLMGVMRGGIFAKMWRWLTVSTVFFAALEITNALGALRVFSMEGLDDILEFFALFFLFLALYMTRKGLKESV